MLLLQQQPIIVKVVEPAARETTLTDVVFGALGLVGVLLVAAALMGLILGSGLIAYKRWRAGTGHSDEAEHESLRVTPS